MPFAPLEASGGTRYDMQPISEPDEFGFVEPARGQFGRLAVDPAKLLDVAKGVGHMVTSVTDAAGRIMRDYRPGSGEFGDEMVQDSLIAGPGVLLPGVARAAGGRAAGELGVMGSGALRSNVADTITWLHEANVPIKNVKVRGKDQTVYIEVEDNAGKRVKIRIPTDAAEHAGTPRTMEKPGEFFDTAAMPAKAKDVTPQMVNESGEPYRNAAVLEDALKWRLQRAPPGEQVLTPPGRAPTLPPPNDVLSPAARADLEQLGFFGPGGEFELGVMGGRGATRARLTPEQTNELTAASVADPTRPAKEIIREFRARHGEGGVADSSITNLISTTRMAEKTSARFGPLNDAAVEGMLVRAAQGGARPAELVGPVKEALGMNKSDRTINSSLIADKLRELEAKGRVTLYGAGAGAGAVTASGDEAAAQDGFKNDGRPPPAASDDQLIFDTQALTAQVRREADDIPYGRFSFGQGMNRHEQARWAQFTAMANGLRNVSYAGSAD